ncbi:MAG: hypothetical protein ACI9HK_002736 [Pirellulaceae bacterium]|jgi:hypothetical protein
MANTPPDDHLIVIVAKQLESIVGENFTVRPKKKATKTERIVLVAVLFRQVAIIYGDNCP